ncbi:MAG TPA: cysteine desulfurase family protein, partial [Candidatus Glassbacteria bacterium]|nr:cysteine desulfurase family protein [Candidatus Glassbacteria bacterium]
MALQADMGRIYLDHNATTPLHPAVLEAMIPWLEKNFGNASSIHAEGRAARSAIDKAREQAAALLGAAAEEIYFTSGGTESNNLAIFGTVEALNTATARRLVTSPVEHHAVERPLEKLTGRGFELVTLNVDRFGRVDPAELEDILTAGGVALVSVIAANNEVGTVQPVALLGEICRRRKVIFHTDAVQAAGKIELDIKRMQVDLLSVSGHKIYGPKGVGLLYLRKGLRIESQILGGSHERRLRAGTENVAGIVGLGVACELAVAEMKERNDSTQTLRDQLWETLSSRLDGVHLNGHPEHRISNTLNVSFEGVEGEVLLLNLDLAGIACSSGSACASGSLEPSHVLTAMGIPADLAQASVRFSLGREN